MYIQSELQALDLLSALSFGAVQTAYANGASVDYLREQGVKVVLAKTGETYSRIVLLEC